MKTRTIIGAGLLAAVFTLSACTGGGDSSPMLVGPSPAPPVVFTPTPPVTAPVDWMAGYTLTAASLSGVIYESWMGGKAPIPYAVVYCERCGEITHTWATADANGFYRFPGELATGGGIWLSPGQPTAII